MAKGLPTLIKLRQRELDALRKRMTILTQNRQHLVNQSDQLLIDLHNEIELAGELADMGSFFGNYSEHIQKQREKLYKEIQMLERKIENLTDEISLAFGELKKFEIALENQRQREKQKEEKREMNQLDEIAARKHRENAQDDARY